MVCKEEYKSIIVLEDITSQLLSNSFSSVSDLSSVVDDTFYFDKATKTIHGKSSITKRGYINIKFDNLTIGDIVECECELRKISGDNPFIVISEADSDHETNLTDLSKIFYDGTNEWVNLKLSSYPKTKKYVNVGIGLATSDVGEFEIRNIRAVAKKKVYFQENMLRKYAIYKMPTIGWTIRTDVWDSDLGATLTLLDANTLQLIYDRRFNLTPIPTVAENFDNNGYLYDVRVGQVNVDKIQIKVVDRVTNAIVDLSALPNYFNFYLTLNGNLYN